MALYLRARRNAARKERHVRDHVAHVRTTSVDRTTAHAALEAVVHAILQQIDSAAAGSILREASVDAYQRQCIFLRSVGGVTTDT